ncbi:hypothetical protein [Chroococcus sp. FPU101]|uniref:hypothetical protein n=1 Tax=Chroococcus sp. FPU101 TaxID=1974212 RepID=UPI001A8D9FD4|nr:hypothetical protein [Chroococcus sp. FPU101]GFE72133.1 hypothetical protein CFPU101_47430 [Chroococcus sp. FPU101]
MKQVFLALFLMIVTTSAAYADCIYDGKTYPTGTDLGGLICQPDGTWKPSR